MGFVEKLKRQYDLRQVDKYTKRRFVHSTFESHDRDYYNAIYVDGDYLYQDDQNKRSSSFSSTSSSSFSSSSSSSSKTASSYDTYHRPSDRWSFSSMMKRASSFKRHTHHPRLSMAAQKLKTSESYTLQG